MKFCNKHIKRRKDYLLGKRGIILTVAQKKCSHKLNSDSEEESADVKNKKSKMEGAVTIKAFHSLEAKVAALVAENRALDEKYKKLDERSNILLHENNNLKAQKNELENKIKRFQILDEEDSDNDNIMQFSNDEDVEPAKVNRVTESVMIDHKKKSNDGPSGSGQQKSAQKNQGKASKFNNKSSEAKPNTQTRKHAPAIKCYNVNVKLTTSDLKKILHHNNFSLMLPNKNMTIISLPMSLPMKITARQNRQNARGGGTAVFVRETIESERIILNLTSIEHTAVKLKRLNGETLTVAALYQKPKEGLLSNDLDQLENLNAEREVLMGADLNAKHTAWGDTEINTKGRRLRNWIINSSNIDIISTIEPSRITSTTSSYIDFFIASTSISTVQYFVLNRTGLKTLDFNSDHKAVEVISRHNDFRNQWPKTCYDYSTMNCNKFNCTLNNLLANNPLPADRNVTSVEIDETIEHVNLAFKQAMDSSIKKVPIRNRGLMNLPPHILSFIQKKKQLKRILERTRDPERYVTLKAVIRNLEQIIKESINTHEQNYWNTYIGNIVMDNNVHRKIKWVAGVRKDYEISDIIDPQNTLICDNIGKVNVLAEHFERIHNSNMSCTQSNYEDVLRISGLVGNLFQSNGETEDNGEEDPEPML
uniref:Endo/exonuclease/phosphatase domain-containing protein n=1 Tax=Glossina austeni TaxID=7395 RepID=A0A1A9UDG7_GLOAU